MKRLLSTYHILIFAVLLGGCSKDGGTRAGNPDSESIMISSRSGGTDNELKPCFIFWEQSYYTQGGFGTNPTTPYVYRHPPGVIDDYKDPRYNTMQIYPSDSEWVYAVGVAPGSLVASDGSQAQWTTFAVPKSEAGLMDIQCSKKPITGNKQNPFSDPMLFEHKLTRLHISGRCGSSMKDSKGEYINVKNIEVAFESAVDDQWMWLPEKLVWSHGTGADGQYKPVGYASEDNTMAPTINSRAELLLEGLSGVADSLGCFYLVPGFTSVTLMVSADYIDSTDDGDSPEGNGQLISRMWDEVTVNMKFPLGQTATKAGDSYPVTLTFEREKILVGVTLEEWEPDINN